MRTGAVTLRVLYDLHQRNIQTRRDHNYSRIEAKGTGRGEGNQRLRGGQGKDGSPGQVGHDGKGHTNFSVE